MSLAVVTGISPKEGRPGTKLTIRGENFGSDSNDLEGVYVCGKNCLYTTEWISSSKITCRVGVDCNGRGDIIIVTKAGKGTCNVQFSALKSVSIGPLEDSNVWVEEASTASFIRTERTSSRIVQQDPLGIKGRQSLDKTVQAEHRALFPGQSPDPSHERFSPIWFLLHHHKTTSFNDLKRGLNNMKNISTPNSQPASNSKSSSIQYIKDSLPIFFEVHEALNSIHGQMGKKTSEREEKGMTFKLEKLLEKAEVDSSVLFKDVLTHKAKADKIRNALAVIQRFKLLFHLPGRVNHARDVTPTENFSHLVADIDKVRSLFQNTKIPVFQRVMEELEHQIDMLQSNLHAQLIRQGITLKDQQQIVRKLIELRASGDPTWDALKASLKTLRERNINYMLWAEQKIANNLGMTTTEIRDIVIEYTEKIFNQLKTFLPDIWRLWILYSTGTLIHNDPAQSSRIKQQAFQHTKEIKRLFSDELLFGTSMLRALLLPETLKPATAAEAAERKEYGIWPGEVQAALNSACLRKILRSSRELEKIAYLQGDKIHGSDNISELSFDLRVQTLRRQIEEFSDEIRNMYYQEDWELSSEGGTQLPQVFVGAVNEFALLSKDVIRPLGFEHNKNLFDRIQVETDIRSLLAKSLCQFPKTLSLLARQENTEADTPMQWPDAAVRLVTVLSNSTHSRTTKMNAIEKMLNDIGIPDVNKICTTVQKKFIELDSKLIEDYLETRRDPIVCSIEPGMYSGFFDWAECSRPTCVRPYIKLCLVEVVAVHAELHSVSQKLLVSVLPKVIDGLGEEFLRLLKGVSKFSKYGGLQARVEIMSLQECTALYSTPRSKQLFHDSLQLLPPVAGSDDRQILDSILNKFRHSMMMQLTALKDSN